MKRLKLTFVFLVYAWPLLVGAAIATLGSSATAQGLNCAPREVVVRVAAEYGEIRQSIALRTDNKAIEVWASPETGTWMITVTSPGGLTCVIASGDAYQAMNDPVPNTDEGA